MYTEIATLLRMERTGLLTYERYTMQVIHNSVMLNSASNTYPRNRTVHMERTGLLTMVIIQYCVVLLTYERYTMILIHNIVRHM